MKEQPRYVLYARGRLPTDPYTRMYVPIFTEPHRALTWLEAFIDLDEFNLEGRVITLASGMTVTSDQMDEILSAKLEGWELPDLDSRRILRFKYGSWDGMSAKPAAVTDATVVQRAPRPEREQRPGRPAGYITITELCAGSSVLPMHARAILRADRDKPAYGWAFDPKEIPAIKKLIGLT